MNMINMTILQLLQDYRQKILTPEQLLKTITQKIQQHAQENIWIHILSEDELKPYIDRLSTATVDELPLYGIPFAIKDNIDLAGIPTTAACPEYRYIPSQSAFVVERLIEAGAIPIGKTNMDQFATGLVGTRSPYGVTPCAFNKDYIAGGSSSGSAVAVAQGLVSFSLGTDTAGSGRIPAAFNNLVGLKPSRGLLSTQGSVSACKTLDCISLLATTIDDLYQVFNLVVEYDHRDPYARKYQPNYCIDLQEFDFGVPQADQLEFFSDADSKAAFEQTVKMMIELGGKKHEIDFSAFQQAAKLLYQGPWVSERYIVAQSLIENNPDAMLDVTRSIIESGREKTAVEAFAAQYRLQSLKSEADAILASLSFLLTPTAGTHYTINAIEDDPVNLNSNLGYYTNYMNLLDYCCVAVPSGIKENQLPFGVSLVSFAHSDVALLAFAKQLHEHSMAKLGATQWQYPQSQITIPTSSDYMPLVVCGAHMQGLPLNHQLTQRGGILLERCQTAPVYQLFALPGGPPYRPGMIRNQDQGYAIEVEVWRLPQSSMGSFLSGIPQPLGLGKVELYDGRWETGFICEGYIARQSENISHLMSWRRYLETLK